MIYKLSWDVWRCRSPGQWSQISLTPSPANLVTKGCLSACCGFLCEHTFSSGLGFLFTPNPLSPNFPSPPLAFFLDLEQALLCEVLVMPSQACVCPQRLKITHPGGALWPDVLFLACVPWGRVMETALWPTLEPLHLYIDEYSRCFHDCRV